MGNAGLDLSIRLGAENIEEDDVEAAIGADRVFDLVNVALAVLATMKQPLGDESDEWLFLTRIYEYLGNPQRLNVRDRMIGLGIYLKTHGSTRPA